MVYLLIKFVGFDLQYPKPITILLKAIEVTNQALVNKLIKSLDQYGLRRKTIAYVKDKGSNLNNMTTTLKSIMKCEVLSLDESFQGTCFDHFFLGHVNMLLLMKKFVEISYLFPLKICLIIFVEMYNLALFFWERKT
jgi:hypothetical protein